MAIRTYPVKRFLAYKYLPEHIRQYSEPFSKLADFMTSVAPDDPELSVALRNLREAKDAFVGLMAIQPTNLVSTDD